VPLSECLDLFMKREQLGADNPWYCSVCKEHRRAFKKFDIWRWPKVLVVHLKRFSFSNAISNRFISRGKLDTLVTFPIDRLDIRTHAIGDASTCTDYQLYAISNHMGGMGGGHYIAHATHQQSVPASEAAWEVFDDHHVSSVEQRVLTSPTAYLLFYRRKDSVADDEVAREQYELDRPNRERPAHLQEDAAYDTATTTTTTTASAMAADHELDVLTGVAPTSNGVLVALDDPVLPSSSTEGLPDVPTTQPDDGGFSD
jgi:hypothetical protein